MRSRNRWVAKSYTSYIKKCIVLTDHRKYSDSALVSCMTNTNYGLNHYNFDLTKKSQ